MRLYRGGIVALVLLLALGGCDTIGGWFNSPGAEKGSTDAKKQRITIMEAAKTIEPDQSLAGVKPQLPPVLNNPNWPQAGFDTLHVLPNAALSLHPEEVWRTDIGEGSDSDFKLLARPVISGGTVFTMDSRGTVMAFNVKDGEKKWEFNTTPAYSDEDAMGGGIGVDGNTVYATTGFGEVLALNAADGKLLWRHMLMIPIRAAPTIADNRVYAVDINNQLQALDAGTGEPLWHHSGITESATLMGASNPAVLNNSVIVAYSSGEIYDLRAENGRVDWSYVLATPTQVGALPAIADIRGLPVIDQGWVFAVSHSGRIAAIDQRTGERVWEVDVGGINTPVVAGDTVFMLSNDDQLIAIVRGTGRILWIRQLQQLTNPNDHSSDPIFWTGPILANNRLWLANSTGEVQSFSPDDGAGIDSIKLDDPIYITPVIAGDTLYVVLDSGKLVALH